MINKEDMEFLSGYENSFRSAIDSEYCRNFSSNVYKQLNDIYERVTGHRHRTDTSCPHCALEFIKMVGRIYFQEKQLLAQMQPEPDDVSDSEPKRKPGRPKKQATNNE